MKDEDFPNFTDLDEHSLEKEWIAQPKMFHFYARRLADARKEYEEAKINRDIVEAEIDKDIRLHPDRFMIPKITEEVVKKTTILQRGYKSAQEKVIQAKHRQDVLQASVDALEHRKKALENLVQLWSQDYFSEPRIPRNGEVKEKLQEAEKKDIRKRGRV